MGLAAIALIASGCQHTVPLEEARKAPVTLTAPPPTPPRRPPEDPAAVLDTTPLEDPASAAVTRERLEQAPPVTSDPAALASFYYRRGVTAHDAGRNAQALADLEQALVHVRRPVPSYQRRVSEHQVLAYLAWAEDHGGRTPRAMERYRQAIAAVPGGSRSWLLPLYATYAWALTRIGDLESAESVVHDLEALEAESRRWAGVQPRSRLLWRSYALNARGGLAEARGELRRAEALYRSAQLELERDPGLAGSYWHDLYQARVGRVLTNQQRVVEGEREMRGALLSTLRRSGRDSSQTAVIIGYLAATLLAEGRFADAEQVTRAGLEIYDRIGTPEPAYLRNAMRRLHAKSLRKQGRLNEALRHFEAIRTALAGDSETLTKEFNGDIDWAYALMATGRPQEALAIVQTSLERSRAVFGAQHPWSALVVGTRASAYKRAGDLPRALADLKDAASILFRATLRPILGLAFGKSNEHRWYLWIAADYIELLTDVRGTALETAAGVDAAAEAFRLSDVSRGRSVQEAVTAAAARVAAGDPRLLDLIRHRQDTARRLAAVEVALTSQLTAPAGVQSPDNVTRLRRDIDALRTEEADLEAQIARDFPAYAQLLSPAPATLESARLALKPDEALVATWVGPERTLVWAVPHRGPVAFATVPVKRSVLCARVNALRRTLNPAVRTLDEIPAFDVQTAHAIFEAVLEPVRAGWQNASTLLVVPDQCLAYLPFSLLPTRPVTPGADASGLFSRYRAVPWLIRSHAVVGLPSVTSLVALRGGAPGSATRRPFVGVGDPYFSREQAAAADRHARGVITALGDAANAVTLRASPPGPGVPDGDPLARRTLAPDAGQLARLPRLPETADEIRAMAQAVGADTARDVFLGARAARSTLLGVDLSRYRVVAFATHGLVPGELEGLTQPALALTSPDVTGVAGDGVLTMEDILGLKLDADWVVLSACNTAAGDGAGAEAVSGLGRAFFYAGARALLVTNWPVETTSARALTTQLFRRQQLEPALTRARALQQTLVAMIDSGGLADARGRLLFAYAHPIFWAPFTLFGNGG